MTAPPLGTASMAVASALARHLARRGHAVHFVGHRSGTPNLAEDGVLEHVIDPSTCATTDPPMHDLALAAKLAAVIEEHAIDVLHVHAALPHAIAASLARQVALGSSSSTSGSGRRPRIVTTLHGAELTLVASDLCLRDLARLGLDHSDAVTCVSESLRREIAGELGTGRKFRVIPDFFDGEPRVWRTSAASASAPAPPGASILHISNFRPAKRIGDVVRTFARVARETPCDLLLIGDGPERAQARELATSLGVGANVRFLSGVESYDSLPDAGVFLLPSEMESFGYGALAAMAAGIPVVGCDAGGLPEVVKHTETGYLLPVGDVEGLADRCLEILRDAERRREMGEAARRRARSLFGADRVVGEFESLYATLADEAE
jgi:N-acetyl-alpha-D-glucosaminyl L-malate synthase BshA